MLRTIGLFGICAAASVASAQSATVSIDVQNTAAPGETVPVTVVADFSVAGQGDGIFGMAGLYGFGGSVVATGNGTASGNTVDSAFPSLVTTGSNTGASAELVGGGTGTSAAVMASPQALFTYDIAVPGDAADGDTIDLTYEGAVVLDVNGTLETFRTDNDGTQNDLTVNGATITVGDGPCVPADLAEPFGLLDGADVNAFITAFGGGAAAADLNDDGVVDGADVNGFITQFGAGCP